MEQLIIQALLALVPANVAWIKYLKLLPDAVDIVKEIVASTERIIKILHQLPLTPEQRAQLKLDVLGMEFDPIFDEEPSIEPPHLPTK